LKVFFVPNVVMGDELGLPIIRKLYFLFEVERNIRSLPTAS
jgi:hypothetical protein